MNHDNTLIKICIIFFTLCSFEISQSMKLPEGDELSSKPSERTEKSLMDDYTAAQKIFCQARISYEQRNMSKAMHLYKLFFDDCADESPSLYNMLSPENQGIARKEYADLLFQYYMLFYLPKHIAEKGYRDETIDELTCKRNTIIKTIIPLFKKSSNGIHIISNLSQYDQAYMLSVLGQCFYWNKKYSKAEKAFKSLFDEYGNETPKFINYLEHCDVDQNFQRAVTRLFYICALFNQKDLTKYGRILVLGQAFFDRHTFEALPLFYAIDGFSIPEMINYSSYAGILNKMFLRKILGSILADLNFSRAAIKILNATREVEECYIIKARIAENMKQNSEAAEYAESSEYTEENDEFDSESEEYSEEAGESTSDEKGKKDKENSEESISETNTPSDS